MITSFENGPLLERGFHRFILILVPKPMSHSSRHFVVLLLENGTRHNESHIGDVTVEFDTDCYSPHTVDQIVSAHGRAWLAALYTVTSILALAGNTLVIVVELTGRETALPMRRHLINLALADILYGVLCVPFTYTDHVLGEWPLPSWMCPVAQYAHLLSNFVIAMTLTVIGILRYVIGFAI